MDAVRVGAVGMSGGVDVADGYAVAIVDHQVEFFAVHGIYVAHCHIVHML